MIKLKQLIQPSFHQEFAEKWLKTIQKCLKYFIKILFKQNGLVNCLEVGCGLCCFGFRSSIPSGVADFESNSMFKNWFMLIFMFVFTSKNESFCLSKI